MRSWARPSSPTAQIAFCTLIEVLRPQILIMRPPAHPLSRHSSEVGLSTGENRTLIPDTRAGAEHDPEKWIPVFGKDSCSRNSGLLRLAPGARLFLQHDRNSVADRIGEAGLFGDQLLLDGVVGERDPLLRADQELQELAVDAAGGMVGIAHGALRKLSRQL